MMDVEPGRDSRFGCLFDESQWERNTEADGCTPSPNGDSDNSKQEKRPHFWVKASVGFGNDDDFKGLPMAVVNSRLPSHLV
jgi:hypothetical protein